MEIVPMRTLSPSQRRQAAQILTDELPSGWSTLADALEEINLRLDRPERDGCGESCFLAAIQDADLRGWSGILPSYGGRVYELHPIVVRRDAQRQGIGSALVHECARVARERGGTTLWAGADDEIGETSLANADLFDDLPRSLRTFNAGTHPSAFYLKLGFRIIGVMPDANGPGRPDIYLAKRL